MLVYQEEVARVRAEKPAFSSHRLALPRRCIACSPSPATLDDGLGFYDLLGAVSAREPDDGIPDGLPKPNAGFVEVDDCRRRRESS